MHSRAIAERRARAQRQAAESATALAKSLGLDEALVNQLHVPHRDPQVQTVLQAENIAELLEAAAKAAKAMKGQLTKAKKSLKELKEDQTEEAGGSEEETTNETTEENTEGEEAAAKDGE